MAVTISNAAVKAFENNVRHLSQQKVSKLRAHVTERALTGESLAFERLAATDAVEKTTRRTATPAVEPGWSNRVATPKVYHTADTIEHADVAKMLVDPKSAYATNFAAAMNRSFDDVIIAAATAAAADKAGATTALPAGRIIGTAGNSTAQLTLDLITQVNDKFLTVDMDPDTPRVFVIPPVAVRHMLNTDKLTSADYMAVKALNENGYVPNFLGFNWIVSNRLTLTAGAGPSVTALAFTPQAIGLGVNYNVMTRVSERPDISYAMQVYMEWMGGAVRVEDEHLVAVHLDQDYAAPA